MSYAVKILSLILALTCIVLANNHDFSQDELLYLSQKWQQSHSDIYEQEITSLNAVQEIIHDGELLAWILFPANGGYLIFSASQETSPLIAVSDRGNQQSFSDNHPLLKLLKTDLPNRIYRAQHDPNEQIDLALEWQALQDDESTSVTRLDTIIFNETPVWGQGWAAGSRVFNLYTPNHWSTGCVATALAEILTYYHWPIHPTGSNAYFDNGVNLSVNYNDFTYDWANTLDNYSTELSTPIQKEAAGLLSYHTAVSVNMDFESEGSTANTADGVTALHYHFRSSGHYTSSGATGFFSDVIANLQDGRPVAMAVDGAVDHAVVADGYADQYGLFHINYGWDGDSNGWYDITGAFLPGYNYTIIGALKGIVPNPEINQVTNWIDEDSFVLEWLTSDRLFADHYELQQKVGSGIWTTLSSSILDTSYVIDANSPGTYIYRVRANRDNIWWDYSREFTVSIGEAVTLEFIVNMQNRPLVAGEELVLLGNIDPLGNVQNSPEFTFAGEGLYSTQVIFENSYIGDTLSYRFGVQGPDYQDIETFNREYGLTAIAHQSLETVLFNLPVGISEEPDELGPEIFSLGDAYPNPFNATLSIPLDIGNPGLYEIQIYDLTGKALGSQPIQRFSSGSHVAQIDFGHHQFSSGVYFVRIKHANYSQIIKCQLLK